jgi:hypothetical protein
MEAVPIKIEFQNEELICEEMFANKTAPCENTSNISNSSHKCRARS